MICYQLTVAPENWFLINILTRAGSPWWNELVKIEPHELPSAERPMA
jgi:hypothetical protein